MHIEDIKRQPISELTKLAKDLEVPGASGMRRQDLIFSILQTQAEKNGVRPVLQRGEAGVGGTRGRGQLHPFAPRMYCLP